MHPFIPILHRIVLLAFSVAFLYGSAQDGAAEPAPVKVEVVRLPEGGEVPDVALDGRGGLHVVYGKGENAFYLHSADGGKTFDRPVRLNMRPETVTVGGERGPKIALGKNGAIHVVWQGHYQKDGGIWATRSTDGGKTFAPERNILDVKTGIDEPTITADAEGNVFVLWLDGRVPENADNTVASPLFMARSTDNGATFGANAALKTDYPGRGCACCMLWARVVGKELLVAFRTGYKNIRDMILLRGWKNENDFRAIPVSRDNWLFMGCPMSGPRFALPPVVAIESPGGSERLPRRPLFMAWMSKSRVYWAASPDGGESFQPRRPAPEDGSGNYPMILGNGKQQLLLLWTRNGKAEWAVYDRSAPERMRTPLARGTAGATAHRPTAFFRPDNTFVVIP